MTRIVIHTLIGLAVLAGLSTPASVFGGTWTNVSIIDSQGWEYEGVDVELEPGATEIKMVRPDGAIRYIPLDRIRVIRDAEGRDITPDVIGTAESGRTSAPTDSLDSGDAGAVPNGDRAASRARRSPKARIPIRYGPRFRVGLEGDLGVSSVSGDWYESIGGGPTYQFRLRALLSDNFYLGASYERQSLDLGESLDAVVGYNLDWEAHTTEIYFLSGWITNPRRPTAPMAFIDFGFGIAAHSASASDPQGIVDLGSFYDETLLSFLTSAGGIFPVTDHLGVNVMGDIRFMEKEQISGFAFGLHAGLVALLGG